MRLIEFGPCRAWSPDCAGRGVAMVDPVKLTAAEDSEPFGTEVMCGPCWRHQDAKAGWVQ